MITVTAACAQSMFTTRPSSVTDKSELNCIVPAAASAANDEEERRLKKAPDAARPWSPSLTMSPILNTIPSLWCTKSWLVFNRNGTLQCCFRYKYIRDFYTDLCASVLLVVANRFVADDGAAVRERVFRSSNYFTPD